MDLSMQMKALRSLNFAKLSSNSSTRDEYWVRSISAGTPAGYCLSQMRSMSLPLLNHFAWIVPVSVTAHFIILQYWALPPPMASGGDGRQAALGTPPRVNARGFDRRQQRRWLALLAVAAFGVRLGRGLGRLGNSLRLGRCRRLVGGLCRRIRPGIGMLDRLGRRFGLLAGIVGPRFRGLPGGHTGLLAAMLGRGLFLGGRVRCNRSDQRGAGAGRSGIDRNRLGGCGRGCEQFRGLHRRRLAGCEKGERLAGAVGAVAGDRVIVVGGRAMPLAVAHLVAQVRRRGVDRRETVHRAERWLQP